MSIEVIDKIERLEAIAGEWDAVLASSRADTVFLTSDWLISWWKGYQPSGRLLCLAVRDNEGKALGFAPFYVRQKKIAGISYRALLFLGDGTHESEYLDIFIREHNENIVIPQILDWLSANHKCWDVCEWNIIPDNSVSLGFIKKWAHERNGFFFSEAYECSYIELPDDYEQYLGSLSKNHRKYVRNLRNRAMKKAQAEFMVLDDPVLINDGLKNLYDLHTRRWNSVGQSGSFTDSGRLRFYQNMTARFRDRGWLRLCQLNLSGRPAAVQIGFLRNGIYSFLQEGYDPDLSHYRPGSVLRAMVIQELIEEGVKFYDFLGYPTPAKERWNTRLKYCRCLVTARNTFRAQIVVRVPRKLRRIKNALLLIYDRVRRG